MEGRHTKQTKLYDDTSKLPKLGAYTTFHTDSTGSEASNHPNEEKKEYDSDEESTASRPIAIGAVQSCWESLQRIFAPPEMEEVDSKYQKRAAALYYFLVVVFLEIGRAHV